MASPLSPFPAPASEMEKLVNFMWWSFFWVMLAVVILTLTLPR